MTLTELATPLLAAIAVVVSLAIFSMVRPPAWLHKYEGDWKKTNLLSVLLAAVLAGVSVAAWASTSLLPLTAIAVSTGCLTFACGQAASTDPRLRLVDRRMLTLATLPPLALHTLVLWGSGSPVLTGWIILMLVSAALIFLPGVMGPSDGRALFLVAAAAFPPLEFHYFVWGFMGFLAIALLYSFWVAARETKPFAVAPYLRSVITKRSMPAVPMIIAPFALLLPLVGLLHP